MEEEPPVLVYGRRASRTAQ
ncbi:hypothetical protein Tco_0605176, partial [Tanacetum coccineum]